MGILLPSICLIAAGCTEVTKDEQALIEYVEERVRLPKGGGDVAASPDKLLVGRYVRVRGAEGAAGVYSAKSESELPVIYDAGCSVLELLHVPGRTEPEN